MAAEGDKGLCDLGGRAGTMEAACEGRQFQGTLEEVWVEQTFRQREQHKQRNRI